MANDNQVNVISEGNSEDSKRKFFTTRNIIIIGVIGFGFVILFAVFYYFLFASKLDVSEGEKISQKTSVGSETEEIVLEEIDSSKQGGLVTLTEIDGKTSVLVELDAVLSADEQPLAIYKGSCASLSDDVVYELNKIIEGESETFVKDDLSEMKINKPLAIVVHRSFEEEKINVSCANL